MHPKETQVKVHMVARAAKVFHLKAKKRAHTAPNETTATTIQWSVMDVRSTDVASRAADARKFSCKFSCKKLTIAVESGSALLLRANSCRMATLDDVVKLIWSDDEDDLKFEIVS